MITLQVLFDGNKLWNFVAVCNATGLDPVYSGRIGSELPGML